MKDDKVIDLHEDLGFFHVIIKNIYGVKVWYTEQTVSYPDKFLQNLEG